MCSWSGFKNHRSFYYASEKGEYLHSFCQGQWETNFTESALIIMFINKGCAKPVQTGTYCDVSWHSSCSRQPCHSPRLPISGPQDAPSANKCKEVLAREEGGKNQTASESGPLHIAQNLRYHNRENSPCKKNSLHLGSQ